MKVEIKAALVSAIVAGGISLIGVWINYSGVKEATQIANKSFNVANKIYQTQDIPRLIANPRAPKFYTPKGGVPGQKKLGIGVIIESFSEVKAIGVSLDVETEDWTGHKTSLFDIYKKAKEPILHILSFPKNARLEWDYYYKPDIPASGKTGFLSQEKPFKVKLILRWKDINEKEYIYVGIYHLKHRRGTSVYFSPISNYDSIKDGEKAWEFAKYGVWE